MANQARLMHAGAGAPLLCFDLKAIDHRAEDMAGLLCQRGSRAGKGDMCPCSSTIYATA
jgi:hypothetical protein